MTLNNEHYSFHIFSRGINAFIKVVICWLSSRILLSCPLYTERTRPRRPWRVWTWKPGRPWSVWTWKASSYHTSKKRKSLQIQYFSLKYAEKYFLKYEEKYIFSGMQRNIFSLVCREITDTRASDFPPAGQTHILHCAESRCCTESADSFCRYCIQAMSTCMVELRWAFSPPKCEAAEYVHQMDFSSLLLSCVCVSHCCSKCQGANTQSDIPFLHIGKLSSVPICIELHSSFLLLQNYNMKCVNQHFSS